MPVFCFSQELKVKSFTHDEMNLEARLDGGRTDLNGKQCALLKVMVLDDIVDCEGGNVGKIITKGTVKKIFVSPTARYIKLEFKYHYPLKITFEDYGCKNLTEAATYEVSIVDANAVVQPSNQQQGNVSGQQIPQQQVTSQQQQDSEQGNQFIDYGKKFSINVGDVSFNMIRVDGGTFTMGATPEMKKATYNERPTHQVTLSTYYIGETEVTQGLWKAVMGHNPSYWDGDYLPVVEVSWYDCQEFIKRLNELTNRQFRLPTEAEWEFAARGGNLRQNTQYSGSNKINEVAWYVGNSKDMPNPVATKKANELGIYDMSGNVWEWCQDLYGSYNNDYQFDPQGPLQGTSFVFRGGSHVNKASDCRSSIRVNYIPKFKNTNLGFRLAL